MPTTKLSHAYDKPCEMWLSLNFNTSFLFCSDERNFDVQNVGLCSVIDIDTDNDIIEACLSLMAIPILISKRPEKLDIDSGIQAWFIR